MRHLLFSADCRLMTIFGYNTDVKHGDTVYHVQSEARQHDLLLQTLIYVKGQCVGKHAFSYAAQALQPDFSEDFIHELLKSRHKSIVESIQQGQMNGVLVLNGQIADAGGGRLVLNWTNPREESQGGKVLMRFEVLEAGKPAGGADIEILGSERQSLARTRSDGFGQAAVQVDASQLGEPAVIARASRGGNSATRKFRFRK